MKTKSLAKKVLLTTLAATSLVAAAPEILPNETAQAEVTETEGMAITAGFDMLFNGTLTGLYSYKHEYNTYKNFWKSRFFWKQFGKGMIVGGGMWGSKELMFQTNQPGLPIFGKFAHSGFVSARDNIMEGIPWNSRYQFDFGPARFSLESLDTKKPTIKLYLLPGPLVSTAYFLNAGYKFDPELTLQTFTPIFTFDGNRESPMSGIQFDGVASSNIIAVSNDDLESRLDQAILAHELIHAAQHRECSFVDVWILDYHARHGTLGKVPDFMLKYFRMGSDIGDLVFALPGQFGEEGYNISPIEFEAYHGYTRFEGLTLR